MCIITSLIRAKYHMLGGYSCFLMRRRIGQVLVNLVMRRWREVHGFRVS
jgi:hypothetical protein